MSKNSLTIIPEQGAAAAQPANGAGDETTHPGAFQGRAAVINLGCAKNRVDSEVMIGSLLQRGYSIAEDVEQAEVAIINTCGFLESAVTEGIDCILDVCELKEHGSLRRVVVAGCMVERYREELKESLPEVDAFLTTSDIVQVAEAASGAFSSILDDAARPYFLYDDTSPRQISGALHSAYLKVSEGCNRPCTFCIIPKIRGKLRTRSLRSVVQEAKLLWDSGVKEFNLVAQDLTAYRDPDSRESISDLLEALARAVPESWVRLLYAYPTGVTDEFLATLKRLDPVCNYLDIPLQHASESVLREMRRPLGSSSPQSIVERARRIAPLVQLRTTFIVGFPGETEKDVELLAQFLRDSQFSSVGIFEYSQESGTPAGEMKNQVPPEERRKRRDFLMEIQRELSAERLKQFRGRELEVLVEGPHPDTELLWTGRTEFQAPEVDGEVILNAFPSDPESEEVLFPLRGSRVPVLVEDSQDYDLVGRVLKI